MTLDYKVPAIDRMVQVLEILSKAPRGISLAELTVMTKIPKSTLFRILFTLQKYSVVSEDPERKTFTIGLKPIEWGNAALEKIDLKVIAHQYLVNFAYETKESIYLTVLDDGEIIIIDRVDTPDVWRIVARLGTRSPFHCTATGQVIVSDLPDEEVNKLIREKGLKKYNPRTISSPAELKKKLKKVHKQGYAVADKEYKEDLVAIAVPIYEHSGRVIASLMTAIQSDHAKRNKKYIDVLIEALKKEAYNISHKIGYTKG